MFGDPSPLDALLLEALDHEARRRIKKQPTLIIQREEKIKESFRALYNNPDNWLAGPVIAVIHRAEKGENTLLGAFQKFSHVRRRTLFSGKVINTPTGAIKYERIEGPALPEDQMFVTGEQWLHDIRPKLPEFPENPEGIVDHQLGFDLSLGDLQVEAKQAQVEVRTERGWIRRVSLRDTTQFFCPTNRVVIFLPKGLDVLDAMSFECKKALKDRLVK